MLYGCYALVNFLLLNRTVSDSLFTVAHSGREWRHALIFAIKIIDFFFHFCREVILEVEPILFLPSRQIFPEIDDTYISLMIFADIEKELIRTLGYFNRSSGNTTHPNNSEATDLL